MSKIEKGSRVRSFDFPSRDLEGERACYVEGTVVQVGRFPEFRRDHDRYKIRVEREVFGGEEHTDFQVGAAFVYPPVNGLMTWGNRYTDGVHKIG